MKRKAYKKREGSIADRVVKASAVMDRHETLTFIVAAVLFWAVIYGTLLSEYPLY